MGTGAATLILLSRRHSLPYGATGVMSPSNLDQTEEIIDWQNAGLYRGAL